MRTKLRFLLSAAFFIMPFLMSAQVTIGSELKPASGALLELKEFEPDANNSNSTKGLLLSRVQLNTASDLAPILANASDNDKQMHTGIVVYHTGSANMCAGVHMWDGGRWNRLPDACAITTHCESATVNGTYNVGQPLDATNTITLNVTAPLEAAGGTYNIYTNELNGMRFSGTGVLSSGTQQITLLGNGAPLSGGGEHMEFAISSSFSNSESSSTLCSVSISGEKIPIAQPVIFGFGAAAGTYGYHLETSASRAMLINPANKNFGPGDDYTVRSSGFDIKTAILSGLTKANFVTSSTAGLGLNPDIMISGYYALTSDADVIKGLVDYLERGGVFILMDEAVGSTSISLQLLRALFPSSNINQKPIGNAAGCVFGMSGDINDEITNGPFGDVRNTYWGADASVSNGISGLPADSIIVYSNADVLGGGILAANAPESNPGYVTMFKHKRLNLFFIGDGGFNSNANSYIGPSYSSVSACPFAVDATFAPIPRTGWGTYGPIGGGKFTVHNSQIFANIMAWAIRNAPSNNRLTPAR